MEESTEEDQERQREGPTTNIRLYLRASNLPKSIINQQPDTLARISLLHPQDSSQPQLPPPVPPPGESGDGGAEGEVLDETEVVTKSSNPRWTASFSVQYEYGSQLLVFVDIFAVRTSGVSNVLIASVGNIVNKRGMKLLGRAVFDVQDVLGSRNNVKARRLRNGGVVYAHVEQQSSNNSSPSRSLSAPSSDSLLLNLRLRANSLIHTHSRTHSMKHRVAPNRISKPDTYYEISRLSFSSSGTWIVVYRSPTVKESVSPMWDEAVIHWSVPSSSQSSSSPGVSQDLGIFSIRITVYKVKKRKCKEIGSCQTTVENLLEACQTTMAKVTTGYENENTSNESTEEEGEKKMFQLRPTAKGGANPSNEITGIITVVNASVENSEDVSKRSQRFLSEVDENDNNTDDRSVPSMKDDDSCASINQVVPSHSGPRPKFSDYVKSGNLNIDFCVAIDFTSSNGDPRIPGTQHFSRDGMMNDYEEAIVALSSTIEKYSSSQEYPVWGFGAKYGGKVRHIFQCGSSPTAIGTQGVLDAYRTVFETDLIMSGPTEIHSVLRAAAARSKKFYNAPPSSESKMQYCVLMILTDGMVNDLQSTQELVRSYRELRLPLSVIVVGIGRADFTEFHQWNHAPSDVRGRFKFVEFRQHQFDPDTLSREALLNVPHETVDYFLGRSILPH
eukprot:CAMPEP_0201866306 /NCGR_PEP_ID=MMETSP0902-20130614/942_1 /ASSEMBLY_ACC=CAM_ASM_000551 /TAXON_ID=420261 /ORGANISM="Thalassiosira antarctica, Strain CCMP982" /LENGTH=671 /DNA_ID=CAMNT_0048391255 /DNA_START=92 /DNA_END=2107 /DNA_ORIENTATION=-